ncbi:hypothetical protein [Zhongshania sp.]|uniref:hypothetical protein n=1 Tax=Zhongshania sp. TaxID=1971902 RepID=UPI003564606C
MTYMEPKYKAETALYWRATAIENPHDPNSWEPGQLCVIPSEVMREVKKPHKHDFGACWIMIKRVENQLFDMMGGMNGY